MVFAGAALAAALFLCPGSLLPTTLARSPTRGAPPAAWPPPRISTQQLRQYYQKIVVTGASSSSAHPGATLHELLHDSGGVLRIAAGAGFAALRQRALGGLCDCPVFPSAASGAPSSPTARGRATTLFEEALRAHPRDLQEIALPDGAVRRTLASATVGFDGPEADGRAASLELPVWVEEECGRDAYDAFERVRDVVADAADLFVARLDRERTSSEGRPSYRELLAGANHLEHFHVYTKASAAGPADGTGDEEGDDARGRESAGAVRDDHARRVAAEGGGTPTLDYHTDAGFFLAFVPALDCRTRRADAASFFLHGRDDAPATFGDDEVVILMGAGARHGLPVRAVPRDEGGGSLPPSGRRPTRCASRPGPTARGTARCTSCRRRRPPASSRDGRRRQPPRTRTRSGPPFNCMITMRTSRSLP